jgi:hypothetical protein
MTRAPRAAAAALLALAAAGPAAAQGPHGMMGTMGPGGMMGTMGPDGMMGMMGGMGRGGRVLDFVAIDTDGNGSLSRAELQARARARLGTVDQNGDGNLDRAEIIAALPGPHSAFVTMFSPDPAEGYADRILALVGATETGQVEIAVLADRRVNQLLAYVDTDHDAAISRAEANALAARHARGAQHRGGRGMGGMGGDGPGREDGPEHPHR